MTESEIQEATVEIFKILRLIPEPCPLEKALKDALRALKDM